VLESVSSPEGCSPEGKKQRKRGIGESATNPTKRSRQSMN
jgi:hypothetical protein